MCTEFTMFNTLYYLLTVTLIVNTFSALCSPSHSHQKPQCSAYNIVPTMYKCSHSAYHSCCAHIHNTLFTIHALYIVFSLWQSIVLIFTFLIIISVLLTIYIIVSFLQISIHWLIFAYNSPWYINYTSAHHSIFKIIQEAKGQHHSPEQQRP